ncbi:Hypothetical Protein FCC1311_017012 [Hondaea fermentalgiana]|uniref:Uncharacterized protein n=1 Tax=Hondaea fermentalgiana TaxID=2315210 RepID=A0A2R5G396_9STRA|nr:Hypothetical Protein FCC1311_017012 [Hondaea fermentalgiana]|eukprot:GBG25482.1 Hypothetical Protein FCC1311_017012 [Hondaea fermentalgiana]
MTQTEGAPPPMPPRTPLTPQTKPHNVVVDDRVTLQVRREADEACARISGIHGHDANGMLHVGQFVVGASLGSAKVSFMKMPVALVQKELARLKSISKPYSLLIADSLGQVNALAAAGTPDTSSGNPYRRRSASGGYAATPTPGTVKARAHTNPQEVTPPPSHFDTEASQHARSNGQFRLGTPMTPVQENRAAFSTPKSTPGRASAPPPMMLTPATLAFASPASLPAGQDGGERPSTSSGVMQSGDVVRIQASLEKLRAQRLAFERLKADNAKKDARIRALTQQNHQLRNSLAGAQETIDAQSRLYGDLEVALERVQGLEARLEEKNADVDKIREAARSAENFLLESLDQEKKAREEERVAAVKEAELLREELHSEHDRAQSEELRVRELQSQVATLDGQLETARIALEDLRASEDDRYASSRRELETIKADRDHQRQRLAELEERNETQATSLTDTVSALSAADQRVNLLSSTIEELEENTVLLRKQLHESERKHAGVVKDLSERLKDSDQRLLRKQRDLDEARTKVSQLEQVREERTADSSDVRQELARKERQVANLEESLQRARAQHEAHERRLAESASKLETLHQRLLAEVARSANLAQSLEAERRLCRDWASQRLDLLDQFCKEEEELSRLTK